MTEDKYNLDTINERVGHELIKRRGDSFDIGEITESPQEQDIIVRVLQNPRQLADMLNVTEEQANNISAVITGAGAGLASKYLGKHFGNAVAGGFGGFLAGLVAEKIMGKR